MSDGILDPFWRLDIEHAPKLIVIGLFITVTVEGYQPSADELAYRTGYSVRRVRRELGHLRRLRILVPVVRGRIVQYEIHPENGPQRPPFIEGDEEENVG